MANVFERNHRIRVDVTSSSFPRFSRNLNNGEDVGTSTRIEVARQTVLHTDVYPSHVLRSGDPGAREVRGGPASISLERRLAGTDVLTPGTVAARRLPEHVREAVLAALGEHGATPRPSAVSGRCARRSRASLPAPADPEREILVTNGAMHALSVTFRALLEPGDEVIVPTPCYFFAGLIERAGGVFAPVPIGDAEAIERAVTPRSRRSS